MNSHENLDNLFEQARQSIALLDKDEVRKIISSPKPTLKPKSVTKTFIIGTAATIVICGAVYFIYPKEETNKQNVQQNTITFDSAKENTNQSPQIVEETPLIISSEKKVATKKIATTQSENLKTENKNSVQTQNEETPIYPNTSIGNYTERVDEEKRSNDGYLHLTNEELAKTKSRIVFLSEKELNNLDVRFINNKIDYYKTYQYGDSVRATQVIAYENKLYFVKGKPGKGYWIKPWESKLHALFLTDSNAEHIQSFYFQDVPKDLTLAEYRKQQTNLFIEQHEQLVPVALQIPNTAIIYLLWFPKNEAFLKKLSKENQEKVLKTNDDDFAKFNNRKINTASLKLLQLNKEELSGLGIQVSHDGISVPTMIDKGKSYYTTYSKKGTMIGKVNVIIKTNEGDYKNKQLPFQQFFIHADDTSNTINGNFVEPTLITDDIGNYWRSYKVAMSLTEDDFKYLSKNHLSPSGIKLYQKEDSAAEQKIISRISTMIPVLVRTGDTYTTEDKLKHHWRPDVILWYEPTDSFFAALPKNIAIEIKLEYIAIKANQPTPSCKYFEVCQSVKGMINEYSVYPNPTNNEINVLIDLAEERKLSISLTDISGKVVKNFVKDLPQSKGKKEYPFQIGEVSEGMYLLLIESDKGERITQRIIKK